MITGIRKVKKKTEAQISREGIIEVELKMESGKWKIFSIYNREGESRNFSR